MIHVTDLRHPLAQNMVKSTYLCRPCNRTRTYVLPAPSETDQTVAADQQAA